MQEKKKPFVIIEIIVAPGKQAQIPLHRGDDPERLTESYAKAFNLNKKAQDMLLEILIRHLIEERSRFDSS